MGITYPYVTKSLSFFGGLHERNFDAGHAIPSGAAVLARLVPDKQQHRIVARLLRSLLHPDPACRPTVDEALDDDFLHGI